MKVNWEQMAREVGSLVVDGRESGGTHYARAALSNLLGNKVIVEAVGYCLELGPGSELARSVLSLIKPPAAMMECYRVFRDSADPVERGCAVSLLRDVADGTALGWLDAMLNDPEPGIQQGGAALLAELVWDGRVEPEEAEPWVVKAEGHDNPDVRRVARQMRRDYRLEEAELRWREQLAADGPDDEEHER